MSKNCPGMQQLADLMTTEAGLVIDMPQDSKGVVTTMKTAIAMQIILLVVLSCWICYGAKRQVKRRLGCQKKEKLQ